MKRTILSTNTLTLICTLVGFLILWVGSLIKERGTGSEFEFYVEGVLLVLGFFLWGCTGLVWMVRKEAPQIVPVKGKPALVMGLMLVIFTWSIALYGIFVTVSRFFN
jgi:hypothetical protein